MSFLCLDKFRKLFGSGNVQQFGRPFQERSAIARARTHTHAKRYRSVINHTSKSNFWLHYTFLLLIWPRYVPILMLLLYRRLSFIIKLKYFDFEILTFFLQRNQKGFLLSPVCNHLKVMFVYTAPDWRKPATRKQFFSKQTCLKNEWRNSLHC